MTKKAGDKRSRPLERSNQINQPSSLRALWPACSTRVENFVALSGSPCHGRNSEGQYGTQFDKPESRSFGAYFVQ